MASLTAVELGADTCALARTQVRRGEVELLAAETLDPGSFADIDAFTGAVRRTRKALKLPRRCRAVVWGLPDGAIRRDRTVKHLIAPLVGAGFRVQRVISPCNALAALARLRTPRGDGATCWLAINRTGVAMVVVRPGQQLYSHSFAWDSNVGSSGSQARLLQRYSLVAFLAPEIRRAMSAAREAGTQIDAIVTCGNLPEIRSLTMPLIEELDVEVESLDSLDGLIVKPDSTDRLSDVAASLRIACAGAIARPTRRRDESKRSTSALRTAARIAAAAIVLLGVGFIVWSRWTKPASAPAPQRSAQTPAPRPVAPKPSPVAQKAAPTLTPPMTPPTSPVKQAPAPVVVPPAPTKNQPAAVPPQIAAKPDAGVKAVSRTPPPPAAGDQVRQSAPPLVNQSRTSAQTKPPALDVPSHPADKPQAAPGGRGATGADSGLRKPPDSTPSPVSPRALSDPLKDPVPRVTAILISSDRRMATIDDGRIISVGEVLGKRVVVAIDERAVVLKEPSGVQIRVGLGGRILGVERTER